MTSKRKLYCSFCGKSQDEVAKLIAGPTVFICNECVALCTDIVEGKPDMPHAQLATSRDVEAAKALTAEAAGIPIHPDPILPQELRNQDIVFFERYVLLSRACWDALAWRVLHRL
jgi:hypothetical protein